MDRPNRRDPGGEHRGNVAVVPVDGTGSSSMLAPLSRSCRCRSVWMKPQSNLWEIALWDRDLSHLRPPLQGLDPVGNL